MNISWKRVGIVAGVVVVLVAGAPSYGDRPFKPSVTKCSPGGCGPENVCGQINEVPKTCGESKDGPFFGATYSCCCCTEDSHGRWFFGE